MVEISIFYSFDGVIVFDFNLLHLIGCFMRENLDIVWPYVGEITHPDNAHALLVCLQESNPFRHILKFSVAVKGAACNVLLHYFGTSETLRSVDGTIPVERLASGGHHAWLLAMEYLEHGRRQKSINPMRTQSDVRL